jgi:hypothetical protein
MRMMLLIFAAAFARQFPADRRWVYPFGATSMRTKQFGRVISLLAAVGLSAGSASAGNFSFTGTFSHDDQFEVFSVGIGSPSTVLFTTFGYAGGTNADSELIPAGGFDPYLSVFNSTGALIAVNEDGAAGTVNIDPVTGFGRDSYLTMSLLPGTYTLILTESNNQPVGPMLVDGFTKTGQGDFTGPEFIGTPGAFWDRTPAQRNDNWAVDVLGVASVTVSSLPEPPTALLLGLGTALFFAASYCRTKHTKTPFRTPITRTD